MRIRREQGLLLVVALIAAWSWSRGDANAARTRVEAEKKEYDAQAAPADPLVAGLGAPAPLARDPFREPSESEPLEPRPLPFPELGALPVVALPLVPGQQPGAYYQLRLSGAAEPFQFQSEGGDAEPSDGAGSESGTANASNGGGSAHSANEQLYDSIRIRAGSTFYGFIRHPDKFALAQKRVFTEPVVYDRIGKDGKILVPNDTIAADQIEWVKLADTQRNRIELQRRSLGDTAASLPERRAFTEYLLREARREPWIYEVAAAQADEYARIAKNDVESYQLKVWVLRERGDLAAQWKLLTELPEELRESAFAYSNRGELEARLGLLIDAEEHLRKAVALEPANAFAQFALARFLLQQGRATAALDPALAARRNRASLTTEEEQFAVNILLVAANLAVGDIKGAREALKEVSATGEQFAARREELKGVVDYAEGKWADALTRFSAAVSAGAGGAAALGRAACQIALGKWEEAQAGLRVVATEYPLLRHRAEAGLGLLYLRTGNFEQAREVLESALRADPRDSYALYLLGRARRLTGLYDSAIDALSAALAESDDLVEAHAEMAASYLALADGAGVDAAQALHNARRHVDRLVEVDRAHAIGFLELQGVIRFREADYGAARQTFAAGREASLPCRIGGALVEYRQNHVQDARAMLVELKDELRSGDATRDYVEHTIALIDDHAEKEQVRDAFDRTDLGRNWEPPQGNGVTPRLENGALHMQGRMREAGRPVYARRVLQAAGKFLRAEVTMTTGAGDHSKVAALEIAMAGNNRNTTEFRARLGKDGKGQAFLLIEDGAADRARDAEDKQRWDPVSLPLPAPTAGAAQMLALALTPDEAGKRLVLQAYWNGELVHQRPIDRINAKSSTPLFVDLVVEGNADEQVDIAFDDFRLVRRREK